MLLEQITIKDEHKLSIKALTQFVEMNRANFGEAGCMLAESKKMLFGAIREAYPELNDYEFSINHETLTISILSKKINQ